MLIEFKCSGIPDLKRAASKEGFTLLLANSIVSDANPGRGTAILIDRRLSDLKVLRHESLLSGAACVPGSLRKNLGQHL